MSLASPSDQEWGSMADRCPTLQVTHTVRQYTSCLLSPSDVRAEDSPLLGPAPPSSLSGEGLAFEVALSSMPLDVSRSGTESSVLVTFFIHAALDSS